MTDSIKLKVSIEHIHASVAEIDSLPFLLNQTINNHGEITCSIPKPLCIKSPLNNAKYQITPVFCNQDTIKGKLIAYEISINVPACTVGNNALLEILVYGCCLLALEFLKHYLLAAGCDNALVNQLDLDHSSITGLTLTYLLSCENHNAAIDFNSKIERYGDATLNTNHKNPKQRKPITIYRAAGLTTVTITKTRSFEAKSYVKVGPVPRSFETFQSPHVRDAVYKESGRMVRLEFNANDKWLKANNCDSPQTWKSKEKASEMSAKAFQAIRDYLRVSEQLRSKRPKPDQIDKLPPAERAVLSGYFDGIDPKDHPELQGKSAQYFSSVKRHIEKELRIDITIPWAIHSSKISPNLPDWMQLPDEYQAPAKLVPHCFVRETAKARWKQLRNINKKLADAHPSSTSSKPQSDNAKKKGKLATSAVSLRNRRGDTDDETSDYSDQD